MATNHDAFAMTKTRQLSQSNLPCIFQNRSFVAIPVDRIQLGPALDRLVSIGPSKRQSPAHPSRGITLSRVEPSASQSDVSGLDRSQCATQHQVFRL